MTSAADRLGKPSDAFLSSLHPSGDPSNVVFIDRQATTGQSSPQGDIVVLFVTPQQCGNRAERQAVTARALAALAPGGILWVGAPGGSRRTFMASLRAEGLEIGDVTVHRRRGLAFNEFTLSEGDLKDALEGGRVSRRWALLRFFLKRVPGVRNLLLRFLPDLGFVAFRPGAIPFGWLTGRLREKQPITVSIATSWRGQAAPYLVLASSETSRLVAKRGGPQCHGALAKEAEVLSQLSDGAARAGLQVPHMIDYQTTPRICTLVETAVPGRPMAGWMRHGQHDGVGAIAAGLADWLARWNRETLQRTRLTPALSHSLITSSARELAERIDGPYREWLFLRAEQLVGSEVPLVAAHNDLTMSNVLADRVGLVSVVDWEAASPSGLPLTDFHYAVCDAATMINGGNRLAAFRACFLDDTETRSQLERLEAGLRAVIGGPAGWLELCFHAGWLRHAANESVRSPDSRDGSFVAIASMLKGRLQSRAPE